jgi:hypothetical protein
MMASNRMWAEISDNILDIRSFLTGEPHGNCDISKIMCYSLKLIVSEIVLNKDNYERYRVKNYTEENFVDMVIESTGHQVPDIEDIKGNEFYIGEIRDIIWGHIKSQSKEIVYLLESMGDQENSHQISSEDYSLLRECLTVCFVESLLRTREAHVLDKFIT